MNEASGSGSSGRNQILSDEAAEAAAAAQTVSGSALLHAAVTRARLAVERSERQAEGLRGRVAHLELSLAAVERGLRALEAGRCVGQTTAGPCARPAGHHTAHTAGRAQPDVEVDDYARPPKGGGR